MRALFWVADCNFFLYPRVGERDQVSPLAPFYKVANPIHEGYVTHDLIILAPPPLITLGMSTYEYGGNINTQSTQCNLGTSKTGKNK